MKKLIAIFILIFIFFPKPQAHAEKINSYDVNIISHKDGKMNVKETINYDFESGSKHGIYRYIPLYSKVGDLFRVINIENVNIERDGRREDFDTTKNKEQIYFKIGNADKTITGPHVYKISYTVENGIGSNFPDHDEIYWNGTGNDWQIEIDKVTINFESDFGLKPTKLICFEGVLGSKDKACSVGSSTVASGQILYPGQGLTAVAVYPKDTFPPSYLNKELPKTSMETIGDLILKHILFIYFLLNVILPIGIIIWYEKHKNKKRFGKPAVNFDIPKDEKGKILTPALAGTIDTARLERNDVVATLFDLAIRRYIKLEEIRTKRKYMPDLVKQKISKLKEGNGLSDFERTLFDRLFRDGGDYIFTDDLKKDFYTTYEEMKTDIFKILVRKKYFIRNPKFQRGFLLFLTFPALFTGNIILSIVLFYLSRKLIGRTALGDEIDFKIDGLKLFLKSMDRNYKWQAEKFYTVEQMIPYAMSLGYIDKFMVQLKIIKPDYNPAWYVGYRGSFYLSYAAFYSSMGSSITTSAPSSSSGASGGFSGGGGGGGGGGSW